MVHEGATRSNKNTFSKGFWKTWFEKLFENFWKNWTTFYKKIIKINKKWQYLKTILRKTEFFEYVVSQYWCKSPD